MTKGEIMPLNGKIDVLGVMIDDVTMDQAVARCAELACGDGAAYVATPNAEIVYTCRGDAVAMAAVSGAALIVPDGAGVVKASKMLGRPLREKVAGVELGEKLLPELARLGKKLYILGAKPGVAERAAARLSEKYPGLSVAGTHDGYFGDDSEVLPAINASGAEVLYVCLGAPRQELWMKKNAPALENVRLMIGLGGSVDIYAGDAERAPDFFVNHSLEWFYRLVKQPGRIGRMMKRLPPFISAVKRQRRAEKKAAKNG